MYINTKVKTLHGKLGGTEYNLGKIFKELLKKAILHLKYSRTALLK